MFRNFEIFSSEPPNYETLNGGCVQSKNKLETQKKTKLRWLATDLNLNCYTLGVLSLMA